MKTPKDDAGRLERRVRLWVWKRDLPIVVLLFFFFDWLHKINPAIMSLVAVISATIAIIAAHIAQSEALRAMRLASAAIASVRSSRELRSSSRLFNSLQADLLASVSKSPIPARSVNSSVGILNGKNGSSSAMPETRTNVDVERPNEPVQPPARNIPEQ